MQRRHREWDPTLVTLSQPTSSTARLAPFRLEGTSGYVFLRCTMSNSFGTAVASPMDRMHQECGEDPGLPMT